MNVEKEWGHHTRLCIERGNLNMEWIYHKQYNCTIEEVTIDGGEVIIEVAIKNI
jgi:hypothetical protein